MRILHTDFDSLVLDKHFNDVLAEKNIRLRTSAPYKHQQNLAERYVGSVKDGIRTIMAYNNAPIRYVGSARRAGHLTRVWFSWQSLYM
jgi:hypothetical protein